MLKYIFKRLIFSIIALFILLLIVFFLMQAIPGYPIAKANNEDDASYLLRLQAAGLLDNVFVQLGHFFEKLFTTGQFGQLYNESISVTEKILLPIQYTMMIAGPAFIISSIVGVTFGIVSAYYRGRWPDILINGISVLFVSIPSFIFALYLIQLAGLIGIPTQFVDPKTGASTGSVILSMIVPILSMVFASVSVITYYTRNELVEVFKQDYIRIALAKGYKFRQVIFKYALRNAAIPIIACLLPSFLSILSGSIIIEKFFNVPGTASILVNAINQKEIYLVIFSTIFYGAIYFILQIVVDILYTFIDPRIVLNEKKANSLLNNIKSWIARKNKISIVRNIDKNYKYFLRKANLKQKEIVDEESFLFDETTIEQNLEFSSLVEATNQTELEYLDSNWFESVNIENINSEQIAGKPTKYINDVIKRFFKSKVATFFVVLMGLIIAISIIITLANLNNISEPISNTVPTSILAYLPPRISWLGVSGITDTIIDANTFSQLSKYQDLGIWQSYEQLGTQYLIKGFNPYVIPELKNVVAMLGTDGLGRDWWTMLWYSTIKSLFFALIVAIPSILIGTIYGGIAGSNAGRLVDSILMRIVEILSSVPLILWIMILGLVFSSGNINSLTLGISLILVNWMWPAVIARTYILKYKDAEFIQAAKTLGASQSRILFTHMLPNISGRLFVNLVNLIPRIIFFETSLVFLGLKSSNEISLGTMIETARINPYPHLLIGPTLIIILITLSAQIISNNLNDALDPRVSGD